MQLTKERKVLLFVLLSALATKLLLIGYGVRYQVHVDEWLIIKDPLKILLQYKDGNFSTSTNVFNFLLTLWHGITFLVGQIAGWWSGASGFEDALSLNDTRILGSFRVFALILSMIGMYFWIRLLQKVVPGHKRITQFSIALFVLNPFDLNSTNWLKFDSVCFLLYALQFTFAYRYFNEGNVNSRKWMYLIVIIACATRIENIAFLISFGLYDLYSVHKWNFRKYFSGVLVKTLLIGLLIYLLTTLQVLKLFNDDINSPKLTHTRTFEEVIFGLLDGAGVSYMFYIKCGLLLLGPFVFWYAIRNFFRKEKEVSFRYFIPALVILTLILAFNQVKNVHYFLATSCILLFVAIVEFDRIKSALWHRVAVYGTWFLFFTYGLSLISNANREMPHADLEQWIANNTNAQDTLLYDGIVEIGIPESPQMLREKIASMSVTGGGTGKGLHNELKIALQDSSKSRNIYSRVEDYYWGGTQWENKWLIGLDTAAITQVNPKVIVVARKEFDNSQPYDKELMIYLRKHYTQEYADEYHFIDPRMYYRTFYYFHSFRIYSRK